MDDKEGTSIESTDKEATDGVYAHLRAIERVHDRMCTRAYVCVNTFVRLSPFACPMCKYTRRAYVGTHCVTCISVHRRLHPYKLTCRNVPRCHHPSNNYTNIRIDSSNSKYVEGTIM